MNETGQVRILLGTHPNRGLRQIHVLKESQAQPGIELPCSRAKKYRLVLRRRSPWEKPRVMLMIGHKTFGLDPLPLIRTKANFSVESEEDSMVCYEDWGREAP